MYRSFFGLPLNRQATIVTRTHGNAQIILLQHITENDSTVASSEANAPPASDASRPATEGWESAGPSLRAEAYVSCTTSTSACERSAQPLIQRHSPRIGVGQKTTTSRLRESLPQARHGHCDFGGMVCVVIDKHHPDSSAIISILPVQPANEAASCRSAGSTGSVSNVFISSLPACESMMQAERMDHRQYPGTKVHLRVGYRNIRPADQSGRYSPLASVHNQSFGSHCLDQYQTSPPPDLAWSHAPRQQRFASPLCQSRRRESLCWQLGTQFLKRRIDRFHVQEIIRMIKLDFVTRSPLRSYRRK